MANGANGNKNLISFLWAGVVLFVAFLAAIVGLALAGQDVTSLIIGLGALLGAIVVAIPGTLAYFQAKAGREENAQTNVKLEGVDVKLEGVAKQVDGMTTKLVTAEVGKEKAEGETRAAVLAVVTAEELAEAIAAPSPDATSEVQKVTIVDESVPVHQKEKEAGGKNGN